MSFNHQTRHIYRDIMIRRGKRQARIANLKRLPYEFGIGSILAVLVVMYFIG